MKINWLILLFLPFCCFSQTFVVDNQFSVPQKPTDTVGISYAPTFVKNKYKNEYLIKGDINFLDKMPITPNIYYCIQEVEKGKKIIAWNNIQGNLMFVRKNGNYVLSGDHSISEVNSEGIVVNTLKYLYNGSIDGVINYSAVTDKMYFSVYINVNGQSKPYLYTMDFSGERDSIDSKDIVIIDKYFFVRQQANNQCFLYKTDEKFKIDTTFQKIDCINNKIIRTTDSNQIITFSEIYSAPNYNFVFRRYTITGKRIDSLVIAPPKGGDIDFISPSLFSTYISDSLAAKKTAINTITSFDEGVNYSHPHANYIYNYYYLTDNLQLTSLDNNLGYKFYYSYSPSTVLGIDKNGTIGEWENGSIRKIITCQILKPYFFISLRRVNDSTFLGQRSNSQSYSYCLFNYTGKLLFELPNTTFHTNQQSNLLLTNGDTLFHITPTLQLFRYPDTLSGKIFFVDFKHQNLYQVTTSNKILKFSLATKKQDLSFQVKINFSFFKFISFYENGDLAVSAFSASNSNSMVIYRINQTGEIINQTEAFVSLPNLGGSCVYSNENLLVVHQILNDEKYVIIKSVLQNGDCFLSKEILVNTQDNIKENVNGYVFFNESDQKYKVLYYGSDANNYVLSDLLHSQQNQTLTFKSFIDANYLKKSKDGFIGLLFNKIYKLTSNPAIPYLTTNAALYTYQNPKKYKIPYDYRGNYKVKLELLEGNSTIVGDSLVVSQSDKKDNSGYADVGKIKLSADDVQPVILYYYVYPDKRLPQNITIAVLPDTLAADSSKAFRFTCTSLSSLPIYINVDKLDIAYFKSTDNSKTSSVRIDSGKEGTLFLTGREGAISFSATTNENDRYRSASFSQSIRVIKRIILSQEEIVDNRFKIYPNPVQSNNFEIESVSNSSITNITIVDRQGKIYTVPIIQRENKYYINTTSFSGGIYILSFKSEGKKWQKRVVIGN